MDQVIPRVEWNVIPLVEKYYNGGPHAHAARIPQVELLCVGSIECGSVAPQNLSFCLYCMSFSHSPHLAKKIAKILDSYSVLNELCN